MATLNDDALLIPGRGDVFHHATLTTDTDIPELDDIVAYAASGTVPTGWVTFGHCDVDDLPAWGTDGGDSEVKRTWQKEAVREVQTESPVDYFDVKPQQFDNDTMSLYMGGGDATVPNRFAAPAASAPTKKAVMIVYIDALNGAVAEVLPNASIRKGDAPEHATDDFSSLPLRVTKLGAPTGMRSHYWVGENFGTSA
ncbi:hypothetical protein [Calidifontibacter indicus]|uniref:phage tail tube protein n=1 Tax=Calidifontibacter indicus TaxID=419650 RepID=UPI003D7028D2